MFSDGKYRPAFLTRCRRYFRSSVAIDGMIVGCRRIAFIRQVGLYPNTIIPMLHSIQKLVVPRIDQSFDILWTAHNVGNSASVEQGRLGSKAWLVLAIPKDLVCIVLVISKQFVAQWYEIRLRHLCRSPLCTLKRH